ncbi:MAG: DUF2554 family protein [Enterobacter sp.]|nr:DUF2554 family protein [Enterobacter sp.]
MFRKGFSLLLLISALFSEESAEGLREHHAWQKSRKPDTHSAG